MAAAVAQGANFKPVVPEQQTYLGRPGKGGLKVGEKMSEAGTDPIHMNLVFFALGRGPGGRQPLASGLNPLNSLKELGGEFEGRVEA